MSDEPSPPVKRSAVTYGRRKAPEFDEFENLLADTSITSMHSVFAASSESGMDLPPSSDDFDMSFRSSTRPEEDEDESEDPDEISSNLPRISRLDGDRGYEFEWKKKLREIDGDAEEELIGGATHKDTHPHKGVVLDREAEDMATNLQQAPDEGPPNSSFPILTGSSVQSSPVRSPSPSISRVKTRRRVVVQDSDSESEAILPGSPASGHLITTPPSGSSSTPPTSQEMVPVTDNKKGKQKAHAIRRRVSTQLSSDEEGPSVVKSKINKKGKTGKQVS